MSGRITAHPDTILPAPSDKARRPYDPADEAMQKLVFDIGVAPLGLGKTVVANTSDRSRLKEER